MGEFSLVEAFECLLYILVDWSIQFVVSDDVLGYANDILLKVPSFYVVPHTLYKCWQRLSIFN